VLPYKSVSSPPQDLAMHRNWHRPNPRPDKIRHPLSVRQILAPAIRTAPSPSWHLLILNVPIARPPMPRLKPFGRSTTLVFILYSNIFHSKAFTLVPCMPRSQHHVPKSKMPFGNITKKFLSQKISPKTHSSDMPKH